MAKVRKVSRKAATHRSGKKKGKLKKGCKYVKGDGAYCGVTAAKKGKKRRKGKRRRKGGKKKIGTCARKCKGKKRPAWRACMKRCM